MFSPQFDDKLGSVSSTMLERLRGGENTAWKKFETLFRPIVLDWCTRRGVRLEDAADVAQEVFKAVVANIGGFRRERPGDSFRGWLWTITQNKLRDFHRQRKGQPQAVGGTTAQERLENMPVTEGEAPPTSVAEERGLLRRALELIQTDFKPRTWQAFWRVVVEDEPVAEVAAALGMTTGSVHVAKSRVLRRLREEFSELLF